MNDESSSGGHFYPVAFSVVATPHSLESVSTNMPWYDVEHVFPLTDQQRDAIARRITDIHTQKFTTPKLFVHVQFRDASEDMTYIAGEAVR
jgi:phenylpyruvate tautomerase PptA (4-oxalocrotonate tautomerase family)